MTTLKRSLLIIAILIALVFVLTRIASFTLFDVEFQLVNQIEIEDKDYSINIYHIPSNASSQSFIQVNLMRNGEEVLLENFENFNCLENYMIKSDTLVLMLCNTDYVELNKVAKIQLP